MGLPEASETLSIGIVSVKSRIFWIQYQVSVSVLFIVKNRDQSRYQSRSMSSSETGPGIGPVQYREPGLVSVSVPFNVQNQDWSQYQGE